VIKVDSYFFTSCEEDVDFTGTANKYELKGSFIVSIIPFASLQTISRKSNIILNGNLREGIQRKYEKEERARLFSY